MKARFIASLHCLLARPVSFIHALPCFLLAVANGAVAAPNATALVDEAAVRLQLGDNVGFVRVLHPLLQKSEDAARVSAQAVLRAADMLWSQGDAGHAWDLYQSVADQAARAERGVALARLMRLAAKLGLWQEFEEFDRAFTRLNSRVPRRMSYLRAKVLYAQGRDAQALRELSAVKRGDASLFWSAEYLRGALYVRLYRSSRRQGDFAKARQSLNRALQAFDSIVAAGVEVERSLWEKALLAKARVLQQRGEYRSAIKLYARVPKDSLYRSDALYESALAAKRLGDRVQRQATRSQDPPGGNRRRQPLKSLGKQARGFYDQAGQFLRRLQEHQDFICHPRRLGGVGRIPRFCSNGVDDDQQGTDGRASSVILSAQHEESPRVASQWGDPSRRFHSAQDDKKKNGNAKATGRSEASLGPTHPPRDVSIPPKAFGAKPRSGPRRGVLAARIAYKQGLLGRAQELYDDVVATYGPVLADLNSDVPARRAWAGQWLRRNTAVSIPAHLQERYRLLARMERQARMRFEGAGSSRSSQTVQGERLAKRISALEAGIDEELAGVYKPLVLSAMRLARRGQVDLIVDEKKSWTRRVESIQQQRNAQGRRTNVLLSELKDGGGQ